MRQRRSSIPGRWLRKRLRSFACWLLTYSYSPEPEPSPTMREVIEVEGPMPTGYCLHCGAPLKMPLCWCGPACAGSWAREGAAYATANGDRIKVEETDAGGKITKTWFGRSS